MCCNVCSRYNECKEKKSLKDNCCERCSDYRYCQGADNGMCGDSGDYN